MRSTKSGSPYISSMWYQKKYSPKNASGRRPAPRLLAIRVSLVFSPGRAKWQDDFWAHWATEHLGMVFLVRRGRERKATGHSVIRCCFT
jgi:hypothetical protein